MLRRFGWVFITLAVWVGSVALDARGSLTGPDLLLQSFLFRTHAPATVPPVTILAIDNTSLSAVGPFPWKRQTYVDLLERLRPAETRPAVLGFDVGFFDETDEDPGTFAAALQRFPRPVVLGAKAASIAPASHVRSVLAHVLHRPGEGAGPAAAVGLETGIATLFGGTVTPGFANVIVDVDQRVRRVHAAVTSGGGTPVPSFSIALVRAYLGAEEDDDPLVVVDGRAEVTHRTYRLLPSGASVAPITVPLDDDGAFLVNYAGGAGSIPTVPVSQVLDGTADSALLRDRIVIIGATTMDLHDIVSRPGAGVGQIPGAEVHAHAATAVLAHDLLLPVDPRWTAVSALLAALLAGAIAWHLRTSRSVVALLVVLLALPTAAAFAFSLSVLPGQSGRVLSLAVPLAAALGTYVAVLLLRITIGEDERRFLRQAFTQYVAPEVVNEIALNPEKLALGGERRTITVLFSDLRNFTALSEELAPEALVHLLNEYFDIQTELVLTRSGVIDKFIGDAMMAFWGAPLADPLQAERACGAALSMAERIPEFNAVLAQRGLPRIAMGVGVNTGPAVVGNMGSSKRFDYTAMGDTVNLASRLEGLTKAYGVQILVSASTRAAAEAQFHFRTVDRVRVKGKSQVVEVSEVVAPRSVGPAPTWVSCYEQGLRATWGRHWDEAEELFSEVLAQHPNDGPAQVVAGRIADWRTTPPPPAWDGAWTWTTK